MLTLLLIASLLSIALPVASQEAGILDLGSDVPEPPETNCMGGSSITFLSPVWTGELESDQDHDLYQVSIPAGDQLVAQMRGETSSYLVLRDGDCQPVDGPVANSLSYQSNQAGTYYLQVYSAGGGDYVLAAGVYESPPLKSGGSSGADDRAFDEFLFP